MHCMTNIITTATCFKSSQPTLLDVILTNSCRRVADTLNINTGISDFHHLVAFSTKLHMPRTPLNEIVYRSYKNFCEADFKHDVSTAPSYVGDIFDSFEDTFWFSQCLLSDIINDHAPLKKKKPVKKPVPYINANLRKACHRKAMLHNRYFKYGRTPELWEKYRKSRNYVTKVKAISVTRYFKKHCSMPNTQQPERFWDTVKPYLSDKTKETNSHFAIRLDNELKSDQTEICNIFNDYFCKCRKSYR